MQFACWIAEERLELLPCVFRLNKVYRFYDNVGVRVNRSPRGRRSFNKFQCRTVTGDIDVQPNLHIVWSCYVQMMGYWENNVTKSYMVSMKAHAFAPRNDEKSS